MSSSSSASVSSSTGLPSSDLPRPDEKAEGDKWRPSSAQSERGVSGLLTDRREDEVSLDEVVWIVGFALSREGIVSAVLGVKVGGGEQKETIFRCPRGNQSFLLLS